MTPLALDLTTHLGKGLDPLAAKASALMEAVERVSAETLDAPPHRATRADLAAAGEAAVDPARFGLPPDSAWAEDLPFDWAPGVCLASNRSIWAPADLALSPPREGVLRQVDTNGLASGNTRLEAALHALCEVIERDAVGQAEFAAHYGDPGAGPAVPPLDPDTLPASAASLLARTTTPGGRMELQRIVSDIALPVVRAVALDAAFPSRTGPEPRAFIGYGCDPSAEVAVNRALTEAGQARLAAIQGARDSFNDLPRIARPRTGPRPAVAFATLPDFASDDLAEDLAHVLGALKDAGFADVFAFDLTRAAFGVPVARIRVPGLTSFLVDRSRVDRRCLRWLL